MPPGQGLINASTIRLIFWPMFALVVVTVGMFIVGGIAFVPTTVVLGPCLRDFTSPFWEERASPLASTTFDVEDATVRVCYGRPSARDRTVFGGIVPYRQLWRTGANEPTRIYTDGAIDIAGVEVGPGRYSLYTIPDTAEWRVFVTESVLHWGNDLLRGAQDKVVGVGAVPVDTTAQYVETFTITGESGTDSARMVLEWERTKIAIPVR